MRAVLILGATVAAVLAIAWTQQRRLIYFPFGRLPDERQIRVTGLTPVSFPTSDGLTLNGWFIKPAEAPRFTVVVFNGNAGNRSMRLDLSDALARRGMAVLLFDYRGFGGNPGSPTEEGLRLDARAVHGYLIGRPDVDPTRIVYFGESLGTAVASELAAAHPPAALILRSPFASMTEVGQHHYTWLPVKWLLRDRYATVDHIGGVRSPVLVIAGERDRIVPMSHSRRVYEAAGEPKTLVIIPGADHNDAVMFSDGMMVESVARFLETIH